MEKLSELKYDLNKPRMEMQAIVFVTFTLLPPFLSLIEFVDVFTMCGYLVIVWFVVTILKTLWSELLDEWSKLLGGSLEILTMAKPEEIAGPGNAVIFFLLEDPQLSSNRLYFAFWIMVSIPYLGAAFIADTDYISIILMGVMGVVTGGLCTLLVCVPEVKPCVDLDVPYYADLIGVRGRRFKVNPHEFGLSEKESPV